MIGSVDEKESENRNFSKLVSKFHGICHESLEGVRHSYAEVDDNIGPPPSGVIWIMPSVKAFTEKCSFDK